MTDFVSGIDADGSGPGPGYEDIGSGEDLLTWAKDSLVPAMFGAEKYNSEKYMLWERNYMVGHNKLVGGVFLMQTRGKRFDARDEHPEGGCLGAFPRFCAVTTWPLPVPAFPA